MSRCIDIKRFNDPKSFKRIVEVITSGHPEVKTSPVVYYVEKKDD
jgi:hypothetical protein